MWGTRFASAAHAVIGEHRDTLVANHSKADKGPPVQSKAKMRSLPVGVNDVEDGIDTIWVVNGFEVDSASYSTSAADRATTKQQ